MFVHVLANILPNIFAQLGFVYLLDGFMIPRNAFRYRRIVTASIMAALLSLDVYVIPSQYRLFVNMLLYLLFIVICYRAKFIRCLLLVGLHLLLCIICETVSFPILMTMGWTVEEHTMTSWWLPAINLTTAVLYWICVLLLHGVRRACDDCIDRKTWAMIGLCALCVPFAAVYMFMNTNIAHVFLVEIKAGRIVLLMTSDGAAMTATAALFILALMIFAIIHRMNGMLRDAQEAERMAEEAELALAQARVVQDNLDAIRRMRHDIKNHLLAIDTLGQAGESDRQKRYLEEILGDLDKEVRA